MLHFVYPIPNLHIDSLSDSDELVPILTTATKYDLISVNISLCAILVDSHFTNTEPMCVYAIASWFKFKEEAQMASKYMLGVNVLEAPFSDDLKFISTYT